MFSQIRAVTDFPIHVADEKGIRLGMKSLVSAPCGIGFIGKARFVGTVRKARYAALRAGIPDGPKLEFVVSESIVPPGLHHIAQFRILRNAKSSGEGCKIDDDDLVSGLRVSPFLIEGRRGRIDVFQRKIDCREIDFL